MEEIALKSFVTRWRSGSGIAGVAGAVLQMRAPTITFNFAGASLGIKEILVTASSDGVLQVCTKTRSGQRYSVPSVDVRVSRFGLCESLGHCGTACWSSVSE